MNTETLTPESLPFTLNTDETVGDPVIRKDDDGTYVVLSIEHDPYYESDMDYILGFGISFEEFRTQEDRDDYVDETPDSHIAYIVDHFEHSVHHYSLHGTVGYPYGGWDTRPSCVLRVPKDFTDPETAAKSMLESLSDYMNGAIYALVETRYSAAGDRLDWTVAGGFIGMDQAQEGLKHPEEYLYDRA